SEREPEPMRRHHLIRLLQIVIALAGVFCGFAGYAFWQGYCNAQTKADYVQADEYLKQGRYQAAGELFHRVVDQQPDFYRARYNLGLAFDRSGRHAEAQAEWHKLPPDRKAWYDQENAPPAPERPVAPLFSPAMAPAQLDTPERDRWQKPAQIVRALS